MNSLADLEDRNQNNTRNMKAIMAQKSPWKQGTAPSLLEQLCLQLMKRPSSGGRAKNCPEAGAETWLKLHFKFLFIFLMFERQSQPTFMHVCGYTLESRSLYINTGVVSASLRWAASVQAGSHFHKYPFTPNLDLFPHSSGFSARLLPPLFSVTAAILQLSG